MKLLIAYATTDGQTRKIARFAADWLVDAGHTVELLNVDDCEGLVLTRFDRAVLAGSLHAGGFQKALVGFAKTPELVALRCLFLPVSLSAAGEDAEDWAGLRACVATFLAETGLQPERIEHVAGAFRFAEYDFFRAWAMRRIAAQKGEVVDPHGAKEYTDWARLRAVLVDWVAAA